MRERQKITDTKIVAPKQTLEESIQKTGFLLEHLVAEQFENSKWSVIHNRYYLDDVTPTQREMDMIAYKSTLLTNGGNKMTM